MGTREDLHSLLVDMFNSEHVYFQPPTGIKMVYPAIKYSINSRDNDYADDKKYINKTSYEITIIDKRVNNPVIDKILELPYSRYNRRYITDNLYHDVITIYF